MNHHNPKINRSLSRREVLTALGSLGLLAALASVIRGSIRFLTPPVSQAGPSVIAAGRPADFPLGELTPLTASPVFVGRDENGLFALSAVCTHLGCTVARSTEGLACPCHGSRFTVEGANLSGPASQPLPHLALALNNEGILEVNPAHSVPPDTRLVWTS